MNYNPLKILRRRARAKGYGVHSPFAYRFIIEVLSERLAYYDYSKIHSKRGKTIYRIACFFHPSKIYATNNIYANVAFMACPKAYAVKADSCDMALISENMPDMVCDIIDHNAGTIILVGKALEALEKIRLHMDAVRYGMIFDNTRDICVIVPNPKLPRQDFELKF